jgi:hypothetical protein
MAGRKGQARGEHPEYELPGQGHPDEQSPEDHHQQQEETGPLRFKHSVLLAGVWRQGGPLTEGRPHLRTTT